MTSVLKATAATDLETTTIVITGVARPGLLTAFKTGSDNMDDEIDEARIQVSVSAADTHVKQLEDGLGDITNKTKFTKLDSGEDESLEWDLDASAASADEVPLADGANDWGWEAQPGQGGNTSITGTPESGTLPELALAYLHENGFWKPVDTVDHNIQYGIVIESGGITAPGSGDIQTRGIIDGFVGLTPGQTIYAGTGGSLTQTRPTTTSIFIMGYAITATQIYFRPRAGIYIIEAVEDADDASIINYGTTHQFDLIQFDEPRHDVLFVGYDKGVVDQEYGSVNQDEEIAINDVTVGWTVLSQSFKLTTSAALYSAEMYLKKVGSPTGNLTIVLAEDDGGEPAAGAIDQITIAASTIPASLAFVEFRFFDLDILDAATTYWVYIFSTYTASDTNHVVWGADGSSPGYADGEMLGYDGTNQSLGKDAIFRIYPIANERYEPGAVKRFGGSTGPFDAENTTVGDSFTMYNRTGQTQKMLSRIHWKVE